MIDGGGNKQQLYSVWMVVEVINNSFVVYGWRWR
jgi:hypothetical protein